jgi:hypothetical protein
MRHFLGDGQVHLLHAAAADQPLGQLGHRLAENPSTLPVDPGADVGGVSPVPALNVVGVSQVPAQMWQPIPPPVQMWVG